MTRVPSLAKKTASSLCRLPKSNKKKNLPIDISLVNHLVNLAVGQTLAKVGEDVTELGSRDVTVAVLVKDLESLLDLLLRVGVNHLAGHHRQELGKVDCAVAVSIHFVDHVLKVSLGRVLAEGAHDCAELLGGDGAIAILIEQGEGLCETVKTNKQTAGTDKGGGDGWEVGREGAGGVDEERGVKIRRTTGREKVTEVSKVRVTRG